MGAIRDFWKKTKEKTKEKASSALAATRKGIANIGKKMQQWADKSNKSDQETIKITTDLGGSTIEIISVEKYAKLITRYIKENRPLYEELENTFIDIYKNNFNQFEMDDSPLGQMPQKIISGYVNDSANRLRNLLIGQLIKRVSKDDVECMNILEILNDEKRGEKINKYLFKVRKEAIHKFIEATQIEVDILNKMIEEFLSGELKNIANRARHSLNEFEKIKNNDGKDLESKQDKLIGYGVIISQCNYVLNKCN